MLADVDDVDVLEAVFQQWNETPDEDLAGLSPSALADLLEDPFEATDVLVFADVLPRAPVAPLVTLLEPLFEALRAGPLRATPRGYLPPELCATIESAAFERHGTLPFDARRAPARGGESRCRSLHVARQTAVAAGLVRRQRGRFHLTRRGRALYTRHGMAGVYPALVRGYATSIEWAALDGCPRLPLLQASVGFSLLLLARFGDVARPASFYAERWLRAFPGVDEVFGWEASRRRSRRGRSSAPPEGFASCYRLRVLERFMAYVGVASVRERTGRAGAQVRATPLLRDMLALRLGG